MNEDQKEEEVEEMKELDRVVEFSPLIVVERKHILTGDRQNIIDWEFKEIIRSRRLND